MATDELETLYREYHQDVYSYVFRRVLNRDDALDITQDVFVRACVAFESWEERGRPKLAWLYTVAGNAVTDFWRSATVRRVDRTVNVGDDWHAQSGYDPIEEWIEQFGELELLAERLEVLRTAIRMLHSTEQRAVMLFRHVDGLTIEETARRLDMSAGAVKAAAQRATAHIRREFRVSA